jgi:DNA-binding NarL/FixJ family response regulator
VEGNPWIRSHAMWGFGLVHLTRHDAEQALEAEQESLALMQVADDTSGSALCIGALACVAAEQERWADAAVFAGAAAMLWRSIPAEIPAPVEALYRGHLELARTALGSPRWSALLSEGGALDRSDAVTLALGVELPETPGQQPPAEVGVAPLTSRQVEVAKLVAQGLTDREIAAVLVISPRTTESHVQNILTRLSMRRRAEVAAWVARHSPLVPEAPAQGPA